MQLNVEQKRLVEAKPNGHALIKGVAGSGKTTIAIHRIPFLLNHYCYENDDKVLMVTYNKTLVEYMHFLYENVEKESLNYYTIFNQKEEGLEITTIDSLIFKYFKQRCSRKDIKLEILTDKNVIFRYLHESIREIQSKFLDVDLVKSENARFLLEEIDWMKACNYLKLEQYQNADRLGRMSYQSGDNPLKLRKNSDVREAIFELMKTYTKKIREKGFVDFKDIALIALEEVNENIKEKYTHIIVDEAQDLTKVQFDIVRKIYKEKRYSSIYFIADTAQSIYSHAWIVNGRSFSSIGFDMTGRSSSLTKNYRTTTQIAQAAYSLIEGDSYIIENENFVKPSLIDRQSSYPVFVRYKKRNDEVKSLIKKIKSLSNEYKYNEIAVITKFNSHLNYVEGELNRSSIETSRISSNNADFMSDSVKLLTIHSVKGLEFKVVFIIGINQGVIPYLKNMDEEEKIIQESNERRLFYVGLTRARELLYLSSFGVVSPFINDINSNYLQLTKNALFKKYHKIRTENYLFLDKINPYNSKESVRQWLINQLINEYNYTKEQFDIDYKLQDVVIDLVIKNKNRIETLCLINPYFKGIEDLYSKLKTLSNDGNIFKQAIITDGNQIKMYNNRIDKIEDIIRSSTEEAHESMERYKFMSFTDRLNAVIVRDYYIPSEITVLAENTETTFTQSETISLSIYGQIAAGEPIDINQEIDTFYLPKDFNISSETFMLQVKGDSMIGADICDGDIVVVNKQSSAKNWDIVVAVINDTVTLKRLSKMGDLVALISENPDYEAISLEEKQLIIMGVVTGVIKRV
ncbi:MAG: S24 family peptidase [Clostridia bacterium]